MRKIHLSDGKVVEYRIGETFVVYKMPDGKKLVVPAHRIKFLPPDVFERGRRKGTQDGQITPREIKEYIRMNG
jgi:hypothetical protein